MTARRAAGAALTALLALAACGSDGASPTSSVSSVASTPATGSQLGGEVTLLAYDSFVSDGTSIGEALDRFTAVTGIDVRIVIGGDAGTMTTKAVLTAGNPEADVMFGIDNTLLSRALSADVFAPYESTELAAIDPTLTALVPEHEVTPVDTGDVCLNYDIAWFADHGIDPPTSFADLVDPRYRDLLVVEDPTASSPGLAFLLATIAALGDGWQDWWQQLRDNGVEVAASWTDAYSTIFSGSTGHGPRPIVVSYASSPPAEVIFADPPRTDAPTAVVPSTCFRQVEFAGVLRGTEHEAQARALVDFLAGHDLQSQLALNLFVYPARTDVELPPEFTAYSVRPDAPLTMSPSDIDAHREEWVDRWTEIVLR